MKVQSNYSSFHIFSSSKTGGIKTWCAQLSRTLKSLEVQVHTYDNPSPRVLLRLLIGSYTNRSLRIVTWGPFNLIPFSRSCHIPVFHGFPCFSHASQSTLSAILIVLSIWTCRILQKKSVSISLYTQSILLEVFGFQTSLIRNAYSQNGIELNSSAFTLNHRHSINILFAGRGIFPKLPKQAIEIYLFLQIVYFQSCLSRLLSA
jgi:hypothetical protein